MKIDETETSDELRAPFPWFGGKRRVADLVWARLGNVHTYNEPFAGSLAVLLGRPHAPRVETVNDLDCYLANFWRALQHDPDAVAYHADSPVNEADLHARHRWLVESARPIAERVMTEPEFFDAQIAGWWVWGQCLWIGSGWCQTVATERRTEQSLKRPKLRERGTDGVATHEWRGRVNAGRRPRGVNAERTRRWQGGGERGGGSGVHAVGLTRQMPRISAEGGSISGVTSTPLVQTDGLYAYLNQLAARLRRVRVCCGDWRRVLTPSVTTYIGTCGVLLDPPYAHDLRERCYSEDHDISGAVGEWARAHGDDPKMRIALCGYEGEHAMPDTWECVAWKAHGGYSRTERGVANRERERIWFSPFCDKGAQPSLFEATA